MDEPDDTEQIQVIPMEMVFLVVKKEIEDQTAEREDQSGCEYTLKPVSVIETEPEGEVAVQWNENTCEYTSQPVLGDKLQDTNVSDANGLESFCEACGICFVTTSSIKNHKKSCNGKRKLKDGVASDLQNFVKMVDGRKFFSCGVCQYETNRKFNFKKHLATHARNNPSERNIHHSKEIKRVVNIKEEFISDPKRLKCSCRICGQTFTSTHSYNIHKRSCQQNENHQKEELSDLQSCVKKVDGKKVYVCDVCNYQTNKKFNFRKHLVIHEGDKDFICEVCNKAFTEPRQLTCHKLSAHPGLELYSCTKCDVSYKSSRGLAKHMATHAEEKLFKCEVCAKEFSDSSNFTRHQRIHEEDKLSYQCTKCPYKSNKRGNLEEHVKERHPKGFKRIYECEHCEHETTDRTNMQRHQLKHLEERPKLYSCDQCGFETERKHNLEQHVTSVHEDIKPFACDECEYKANRAAHLQRHKQTVHSKEKLFVCDLCSEYKTSDKSHLVRHMRCKHPTKVHHSPLKHSLEKKPKLYSCDQCGFKVAHKCHLEQHVKGVHENIRPFACDECEYEATRAAHLQRHKQTVHLKAKQFTCEVCSEYKTSDKGNLTRHMKSKHPAKVHFLFKNSS